MKKQVIALTACALIGLGGCATAGPKESAESAITDAEKELAAVKKAGFEWQLIDKSTGSSSAPLSKMLEAAKKALADGNTEEATRIANRVADAARLGQQQAADQANAVPIFK